MNCKLCGSADLVKVKDGIKPADLTPSDFSITDKRYGTTLEIVQCNSCRFQFCPTAADLVKLYEAMDDDEYTESDRERKRQFEDLFKKLKPYLGAGQSKSLDIGCGSGLLVELFKDDGFEAYGVEPSKSLAHYCKTKNLNVTNGTLSQLKSDDKFDVITLIDVIEHVADPEDLVADAVNRLNENGILCVVTPRTDSISKKLLGFKWWHYRIAHVGYFTKNNLETLLKKFGTQIVDDFSPSWYFSLENLIERVGRYIPFIKFFKIKALSSIIIRLNLHDSIALIVKK